MLKVFCYMIKLSCIMADLIDIFFRFETDNGKLRLISIEIDMSILSMVVFLFHLLCWTIEWLIILFYCILGEKIKNLFMYTKTHSAPTFLNACIMLVQSSATLNNLFVKFAL